MTIFNLMPFPWSKWIGMAAMMSLEIHMNAH